jgi:hypothetical protein
MPSPTWTPDGLSSEARAYQGRCWRLVEAQHRVSTLKLVDTLDEQTLLENLIEKTKPAIPPECRHLDYLFSTPFRYGAVHPHGSRFRRAGRTPGIYYAAEAPRTAVAESRSTASCSSPSRRTRPGPRIPASTRPSPPRSRPSKRSTSLSPRSRGTGRAGRIRPITRGRRTLRMRRAPERSSSSVTSRSAIPNRAPIWHS